MPFFEVRVGVRLWLQGPLFSITVKVVAPTSELLRQSDPNHRGVGEYPKVVGKRNLYGIVTNSSHGYQYVVDCDELKIPAICFPTTLLEEPMSTKS